MSSCSPLQLSASFKRYYAQLRHPTFAPANTPLHVAALNNDYNRVHRLLTEGGGDPNITDQVISVGFMLYMYMSLMMNTDVPQTGCTALNHAALLGNAKICELLITTGAIINDAAHDGSTPLHKAAQGGRTHIVELLLREGADPFAVNKAR
ncbi:hypothetical protein PInf_024485 [Phytophthora infestans]|nr:hypothetical protein PInf_024485 [Phytophthora infestans]